MFLGWVNFKKKSLKCSQRAKNHFKSINFFHLFGWGGGGCSSQPSSGYIWVRVGGPGWALDGVGGHGRQNFLSIFDILREKIFVPNELESLF